jgi:hypothetical protein
VHGVKIVRSRKIFIDFEPSMDLTGGKYHDAGAAGGDARYDRASCALVSYPPPCVKKNRVSTLRWRYDVTFAMSHCSGTSCPNLPYTVCFCFSVCFRVYEVVFVLMATFLRARLLPLATPLS